MDSYNNVNKNLLINNNLKNKNSNYLKRLKIVKKNNLLLKLNFQPLTLRNINHIKETINIQKIISKKIK